MSSVPGVWEQFLAINLSFPVVFFTFFLVLSLIYWSVAAFGLVDIDVLDVEVETDVDLDASADVGAVSGLLMRMGLNGVPLTIIITLISFFGWLISSFAIYYLLPFIPTWVLKFAAELALLVITLYCATLITALVIRPIRPFFLSANQQKEVIIIGRTAIVRTGTVDTKFGEATLDDGGAGLILKVRAYDGQTFSKGDRVVILERDPLENTYKIISEQEYQN